MCGWVKVPVVQIPTVLPGCISDAGLCASPCVTRTDNSQVWTLDRTLACLHCRNVRNTTSGFVSDPLTQSPLCRLCLFPPSCLPLKTATSCFCAVYVDGFFPLHIASVHLSLHTTAASAHFLMQSRGVTDRKSPWLWSRLSDQIKFVDEDNKFPPSLVFFASLKRMYCKTTLV